MPTTREANKARSRQAFIMRLIMDQKIREAQERLELYKSRQSKLLPAHEKYLENYKLYIKPYEADSYQYLELGANILKLEHFLQSRRLDDDITPEKFKVIKKKPPKPKMPDLAPDVLSKLLTLLGGAK